MTSVKQEMELTTSSLHEQVRSLEQQQQQQQQLHHLQHPRHFVKSRAATASFLPVLADSHSNATMSPTTSRRSVTADAHVTHRPRTSHRRVTLPNRRLSVFPAFGLKDHFPPPPTVPPRAQTARISRPVSKATRGVVLPKIPSAKTYRLPTESTLLRSRSRFDGSSP